MHGDLSPHLHTPGCNAIIDLYKSCQRDHPFRRFLGHCSQLDREMVKCLRKERFARQKANAAAAEKKKIEVQERMKLHGKEQKGNQ